MVLLISATKAQLTYEWLQQQVDDLGTIFRHLNGIPGTASTEWFQYGSDRSFRDNFVTKMTWPSIEIYPLEDDDVYLERRFGPGASQNLIITGDVTADYETGDRLNGWISACQVAFEKDNVAYVAYPEDPEARTDNGCSMLDGYRTNLQPTDWASGLTALIQTAAKLHKVPIEVQVLVTD